MKLVDIPEFTTGLISTLEKKNLATDFRKRIVRPENTKGGAAGKQKDPANSAKTQITKGEDKKEKFKKEYSAKCCTSKIEDEKRKKEILSFARTRMRSTGAIVEEEAVVDDPVMRRAIQKHNEPICGACLSRNCQLRQIRT